MSKKKFKDAEEFENKFLQYIQKCKNENELPNIAGFSIYYDMNRNTFYEQNKYYYNTFKKINDILEDATINCKDINDTFKIFYMKNKFGYKDKQENINVTESYEEYIKRVGGNEY